MVRKRKYIEFAGKMQEQFKYLLSVFSQSFKFEKSSTCIAPVLCSRDCFKTYFIKIC